MQMWRGKWRGPCASVLLACPLSIRMRANPLLALGPHDGVIGIFEEWQKGSSRLRMPYVCSWRGRLCIYAIVSSDGLSKVSVTFTVLF